MIATQVTRFASVGVLATLVHVGVALLAEAAFGLGAQAANSAGFAGAVILSYLGQGQWTFGAELQHRTHGPRFLSIALLGYAVSSLVTLLVTGWMGAPFIAAMAAVAVIVPGATFLACKFWVFRPGS